MNAESKKLLLEETTKQIVNAISSNDITDADAVEFIAEIQACIDRLRDEDWYRIIVNSKSAERTGEKGGE